ncbi:MAG TPA: hypothetical protein VFX09_01235 [Burkholderiales bacterium]|nr:hypothetical protein [Burkholderiales bacterium]
MERKHSQDNKPREPGKVEGEGSYSGTRDYNERTRKFMDAGRVEQAARDARPESGEQEESIRKAERKGRARARGEDPALNDPEKIPDDPDFPRRK